MAIAVAVALIALGAGCGGFDRSPGAATGPAGHGVVTHVVDGDTIDVRIQGTEERVRLIGIDTPESVIPDRPVDCFGPEASDRARELVPAGTRVRLERDVEARDRYGRLLAYVHRAEDGLDVNLTLVAEGFAEASRFEPNVARQGALKAAEAEARAAARGLWGACRGSGQRPGR